MIKRMPTSWRARGVWGALLGLAAFGCGGPDKRGGELHAQRVLLEREVSGLRESVARLEKGEAIFPQEAVVISIAEGVVKEFVDAQLPVRVELESFQIELKTAAASFKGSPTMNLTGTIVHKEHPDLVGEVFAIGALESIEIAPETGTLRAALAVDHVDLLQMGGLERFLSGGTVNELARRIRHQLEGHLPQIQIPVRIEPDISLPSVTHGPVRLRGASMPLTVSVARVLAGQGVLWIAVNVVPGDMVKTAEQPAGKPARKPVEKAAK
jgi:hypothetical protein